MITTFKVRGQGNGANAVKSPISQGIGFRVSRQYTLQYNYSPVRNKISQVHNANALIFIFNKWVLRV